VLIQVTQKIMKTSVNQNAQRKLPHVIKTIPIYFSNESFSLKKILNNIVANIGDILLNATTIEGLLVL
jgi:hypothetical protein